MSTPCDQDPQKVVTFYHGVILKPETGALIPTYFQRGQQVCLIEPVTRMEDCGCDGKPAHERIKEVVYYRFSYKDKTWLVHSDHAGPGVKKQDAKTEDEYLERIASLGDAAINPTQRNDAAIAAGWGKLTM